MPGTEEKGQRATAALPRRQGRRPQNRLPLPQVPNSSDVVDSVLRSAGAVGAAYLEVATGQEDIYSDEWEDDHTPADKIVSDDSGDEDYTPLMINVKRPGFVNAIFTVVEPSPSPELFDIDVLINDDPVQLPEKPVKGPLVSFPPIWAEAGMLYHHPVSL